MVVAQGDIWWVDLLPPTGSEPGFRRPMVVVQGDALNQSGLNTAVCVSLTTNLRLAAAQGNVLLPAEITGLPQDSVANVSQVQTVDLSRFDQHVSTLPRSYLRSLIAGIDLMLGR